MKIPIGFNSLEEKLDYERAYNEHLWKGFHEYMNTNKEALNTAINNLSSICPKGREEVRALVETITGVKLKEEEIKLVNMGLYERAGHASLIAFQKFDKDEWALIWYRDIGSSSTLSGTIATIIEYGTIIENYMCSEYVIELFKRTNYKYSRKIELK